MAREFAQIKLAIWADDDWRDLSSMARYLYLTLLTSPTLSHCGVADWRPARIASLNGMSSGEVEDAGAELVDSLHLVIDEESEEVLIRSFVRNDGLMKQPKMAVAMASAHAGVASREIRGVIVHELRRLRSDRPDLNGWGSDKAIALLDARTVDPSEYPLGKGSRKGKPTPFGKGSGKGSPTPAPTPTPTTSSLSPSCDGSADAIPGTSLALVNDDRPDVERICEHLAEQIEARGSKRPEITARWRNEARLLIDRDKRTEEQVHACIRWLFTSGHKDAQFWRVNVRSMPKLREEYDRLRELAERSPSGSSRNQEQQDLLARAMARAEERERNGA